jgi:hypothetical protein
MSLDWLSKQMRTRISVITASPRETEMTEYLDIIQDEREYTEQEISTQISLHNELYKVLAQKTSIEQANSVNQLTLLATFFLPLSLAAAILLMQTRFADLGVLLYDFLGVMVILIALALLVAGFNAYGRSYYDDFLHEVYFALRAFPAYPRRITIFWSSLWISASLVSFLLGMLKSVDLGGTVLGYEAAAIVGLWLASLPAFFLFVKLRQY